MANEEIVGINTPKVYKENDQIVYRASSLGGCLSCLVAQRIGYDPAPLPEWLLERFSQGQQAEGPILAELAAETNLDVQTGQDITVELVSPSGEFKIVGHIDGWAKLTNDYAVENGLEEVSIDIDKIGVEAKAFAKTYWNQWNRKGLDSFDVYKWQLSIYMHATGWPFIFVVGKKEEGSSNIEAIDYKGVLEAPISLDEIWARVQAVEELAAKNEIPIAPVTIMCTHGQFHTADDEELMPENELTDEEEAELVELSGQYSVAAKMEKDAKKLKKELSNRIIELMEKGKVGKTYDSMVIRVTRVDSHTTWYDVKKMRENGLPVDDYERHSPYSYPKVTEKYSRQEGGS